jgi:hypothetical protein
MFAAMRVSLVALCLVFGCGGSSKTTDGGGPRPDVAPPPADDPVEPVWDPGKNLARVKSPGQRMHFTEGLPFRILADANDIQAYECPPGSPPYVCADSNMEFFIDGVSVGVVPPSAEDMNLWELRLPNGLTPGDHVITVKFKPHKTGVVDGLVPVYIYVDPLPGKTVVELSADLVLSGSMELNWTDVVVKGNGHVVRSNSGYTGRVVINNAFVTGLAGFDNKIGMTVATSGGIEITKSVFEATAPLKLTANGSAPISIVDSEFRSSNYVTYESSDPNRSPILEISGNTSGTKTMKGTNVGAGIVKIVGMSGWQIGGLTDREGNIFVGPRCVLELESSPNAVIQGNYLHHDYYGGFSQGFNLIFNGSTNAALAEHNVIRDASWPLQAFGGEFRYNLMINSGHDFIRSSQKNAKYHHNLFVHAQAPNSGFDGAVLFYGGESGVVIDNNTFDVGGDVAEYDAPAIVLSAANVSLTSLRSNIFTRFKNTIGWNTRALVAGDEGEGSIGTARVMAADNNAWHNPMATQTMNYLPGIVSGGSPNDVTGDPMFSGAVPEIPYKIAEGAIWTRKYGISGVLAYYRELYTPATGSPLIDKGHGGAGNDIGAIGAGTTHADDKFGLVMEP